MAIWASSSFQYIQLICVLILFQVSACKQSISSNKTGSETEASSYQSIVSGVPWYTEMHEPVSAHGANIIFEDGVYYWIGEYKNNESNWFEGFSCYSSTDLYNWDFRGIVLPPNKSGRLSGEEAIGERPKVMKCPSTGMYFMYFHADANGYRNPTVEYATATSITGPYSYQGALLFEGEKIKRWDMGTFQDDDGSGYIVMHHGDIYKLSEDYTHIAEQVLKRDETLRTESPVVFKRNAIYYWIGSGLTGWERNDNMYFTSTSLSGPWKKRGFIAPEGSITWDSQSTFVLPIKGSKDTTYMYMGDRWSFPKQRATATYVWQPLVFKGDEISMPTFQPSWAIDLKTGIWKEAPLQPSYTISYTDESITKKGNWKNFSQSDLISLKANKKEASLSIPFTGRQIALVGIASKDCGYARVTITNASHELIHDTWIDMYANKTSLGLQYMSPKFASGDYTLTLSPTESHWYWTEKSGKQWGSEDTYVSFAEALVF